MGGALLLETQQLIATVGARLADPAGGAVQACGALTILLIFKYSFIFVDEIGEDAAGATQPAPSPSDAEYLRDRIQKALAQLPPLLREAFTLFQIGELSIREIAHETGASESLVKVRIHRAKQKLQVLLADLREP